VAVILANTTLSARRKTHAYTRDAHGTPVAGVVWGAPLGPFPGATVEPANGPQDPVPWKVRADVRLHPLQPDDELTDASKRVFIVRTARLIVVPGYDYVDHIEVTAELTPPYTP